MHVFLFYICWVMVNVEIPSCITFFLFLGIFLLPLCATSRENPNFEKVFA
jgi:hypothetical protein